MKLQNPIAFFLLLLVAAALLLPCERAEAVQIEIWDDADSTWDDTPVAGWNPRNTLDQNGELVPGGYILMADIKFDSSGLVIDAVDIDFNDHWLLIDGREINIGANGDVNIVDGDSLFLNECPSATIRNLTYEWTDANEQDEGLIANAVGNLEILNSTFYRITQNNFGAVHIVDCEGFEVRDCAFSLNGRDHLRIVGASSGIVQNCTFTGNNTGDDGGPFLFQTAVPNGQELIIRGNRIINNPHGIQLLAVSGNIIIEHNFISGGGVGIETTGGDTPETVIKNNVICNVRTNAYPYLGRGFSTANGYGSYAVICNNLVFGCQGDGIGGKFEVNGDQVVTIKNNICWDNAGSGFAFDNNSEFNDIVFTNNISGNNGEFGIFIDDDPGANAVEYLALKGNWGEQGENAINLNIDRLDSNCVIYENGDLFKFVDETPDSNGWDFHAEINDVWPVVDDHDSQYNNLIALGELDQNWLDPDESRADIGIFGGPYADQNINVNRQVVADYCWVNTTDWFNEFYGVWTDIYLINPLLPDDDDDAVIESVDDGGNSDYPVFEFAEGYGHISTGNFSATGILFRGVNGASWSGITFDDPLYLGDCSITNSIFQNAQYGLKLLDCDNTSGARLSVENCTFQDCGTGVYANNSRLHLKGCEITGSVGVSGVLDNGIYLTSCSSGKVIIEDCNIHDNGVGSTIASAGIFLSSSDPEIIWTTVQDNSGGGIACTGSTPDLDTYDLVSDRPNSLLSNGSGTQSGSNGAEIYLASSSYPDIKWNNIVDYSSGPVGYMIYKEEFSNYNVLTATDNWWGTSGTNLTSSFFYWGPSGLAINYSSEETGELSNAEQYAIAMQHWSAGEFAECAEILEECVFDTGSVGINSVHYLSGCVGETPVDDRQGRLSYAGLRDYLQGVAEDHQDADVAKVANRFATDCLTQLGEFDDALEEYDAMRENAECIDDSVMALLDWLAVYELANGHEVQSSGGSIQERMGKAFAALARGGQTFMSVVPEEFTIEAAWPNPFNSTTKIRFGLDESRLTRVSVHDVTGREVAELQSGWLEAGWHQASWQADGASAGVYFMKVVSGDKVASRKVLLVK